MHITYAYIQATIGIGLFVRMYSKAMPIVRKQVVMLSLGAAAPWLSNVVYLLAFDQVDMDLTPLGFTVTGLVYIWGIYRFNLLRLVPVAYQTIFETMLDGAIIIDYDRNITHVNQAARSIFEQLEAWQSPTVSVDRLFASNPDLLAMAGASESCEGRISIRKGEETRYYQVKLSVIYDKSRLELGKILVFSDITSVVLYQEQLIANANQLTELDAFKDKAFAIVTHDIRDPLAMLVNLTDIIEEDFIGADASQVSDWAESGVLDSLQAGIVSGRSGNELAPQAYITRAEVAVIIQRLLRESELI